MKLDFFVKIKCLIKIVKKYFLKKLSVYKNGNLRDKLPKMTMYR